jgi:hypothetical protein
LPRPRPPSRRRRALLLRSLPPRIMGRVTRRPRPPPPPSVSRSWAPKTRRRPPRLPTSMVRPPGMVRQRRWGSSGGGCSGRTAAGCCRLRWFQNGSEDSLR